MKTMSKLLAILMACALLVGCVPALAEVPEGYPELRIDPATGKPYDLGGITVYMYTSHGHHNEDGSRNEAKSQPEQDMYDYQDWLFETYNFEFKYVKQHLYEENAKALVDFASQEVAPAAAFFLMTPFNTLAPMREGLLHDLNALNITGIDFQDEERYQQGVIDNYTVDGKLYAINNNFNIGSECFLLFNKELLTDAGYTPEQLYAWVENGEWTWEKYEEVLDACTIDKDADGYIDQYGFTGNGQPEFVAAMASNGGSIFSIGEDGKFYVSANEDATVDALNWMDEMWHWYNTPYPAGASWDYYYDLYKSGKAVFFLASNWEINGNFASIFNGELFEVGCVPFPKGPGANAKHPSKLADPTPFVIPANVPVEDAQKMLIAFDLINTPTPGYSEEDEVWKIDAYNMFMDEESVDITYALLRESTYIDFTPMLGTPNDVQANGFIWSLMNSPAAGTYTIAELVEGKMPMWTSILNEANGVVAE